MKKSYLWAISLALVASAAFAGTIPADDPNIQYIGRVDCSDREAPLISWPGPAVRANFTGTSLKVTLRDEEGDKGGNMFNVFIDGNYDEGHVINCTKGESTYTVATGLEDKTHELLLAKRTEGEQGNTVFLGLELVSSAWSWTTAPR